MIEHIHRRNWSAPAFPSIAKEAGQHRPVVVVVALQLVVVVPLLHLRLEVQEGAAAGGPWS